MERRPARAERAWQYKRPSYRRVLKRLAANAIHYRGEHGWTQEDAANRCKMPTRQYQYVEHASANVTMTTIARLCEGLGVDVVQLFERRP